ncbi:ovochymase-1 isoform X3 [Pseudophryne corroboree]|uniref:ovochymase-1 isoform X3 n=1 Tax=Pseudophryne corroboree TaxID=495146 RepID=UPI0030816A46
MFLCILAFPTLLLSWGVKCGVRHLRKDTTNLLEMNLRIVGGVQAAAGEQPWTVSLQLNKRHICGGAIVEKKMVVTAAHCVYPVSEEKVKHMTVVAGEYDRNVMDPQQQNIPVSYVKVHPNYRSNGSMSYDIALVYLYKKIVLGTRVQPVCLPQVGEKFEPGTLCITSGWGRVNENLLSRHITRSLLLPAGALSDTLQEVKLPLLDDGTCSAMLDSMRLPPLHRSMICAGFPDGGKDACQGDSGGPLVCKRRSGSWVLVGCTSWGVGCGRSWGTSMSNRDAMGSPAIYAKVSALLDFLRNSTADSGCSSDPLVIVAVSGIIKYPLVATSNYSSNSLCRWTIISSKDKIIQIQFIKLDIEDHVTCAHDSLTFTVKLKDFRKVCGSILPSPLIIPSNKVTVTFLSDNTVNGGGFKFKFSTLPATSGKGSGCGSVAVLKEEGKIFSLNYPGSYPSLATCRWVIEAPEGDIIQLIFEDFALEYQEECEYDRVSIYGDRDETLLIKTLCGFSVARPVLSPSNVMVITFKSDLENNYSGFAARFSFIYPNKIRPFIPTKPSPIPDADQEPKPSHVNSSVCGVAPLSAPWLLNRIVGGEEACSNCWPWHVELLFQKTFQCGGVILSTEWVLTAAHCLPSTDISLYVILAGIHDRHLPETTEQERTVQAIAVHERFDVTTYDYDVALLRLKEKFNFNDFVRPVCLPKMDEPLEPSSLCVVTGWGSTEEGGQFSSRLQQLQVPILDTKICNSSYYHGQISERMFCAGFPDAGGKDSCQGDSGGPLVCPSADKSYVLYGIVSWGVGCARVKRPGVYARVRSFLCWIQNAQKGINQTPINERYLVKNLRTLQKEDVQPAGCPDGLRVSDSTGFIASPGYPYGYPGNLNCSWLISSRSSSSIIKIVVEHQSIKKSINCVTESLSVYQEVNNGSQLLGKTCGFLSTPITYECRCPMIRVVFISNREGLHGRRGFALQYKIYGGQARQYTKERNRTRPSAPESCTDVIVTTDNGVISSPGYPDKYLNDLRCEWRIIAPLGSVVRLGIERLCTEQDVTGCQDSLLVYDGIGESKVLLGSFCGNVSHYAMKSSAPGMTLVFTTNSKVVMDGFSLRYSFWKVQPDAKKMGAGQTAAGCPTLDLLTAGSADVRSPNYPSAYPSRLDCWWIINLASGNRLEVLVVDLALEDSPNCTWDFLSVYDGTGNRTQLLVTLCGNMSNLVLYTSSNFLTLHFHTDVSVASRGFHIHYSEITTSPTGLCCPAATSEDDESCGNTQVDPMPKGKSVVMAEVSIDEKGTARVVGGHTAPSKSWPWVVSLQDKNGKFFCGAAIIHEKWILTAAHCDFMVGSDRVFVGQTNLSQRPRAEAIVRKAYVHEKYDKGFLPPSYDICLLELETSLVLGDSIAVICLPQDNEVLSHDGCLTAGWGATKGLSTQYTNLLQQAKIPLVPAEDCMSYWGTDITEGNLCAGAVGASSCLGDSGGPLICSRNEKYMLVGVVSWGSGSCDPNTPAVYTSVAKYRDWIKRHAGF